MPKQYRCREGTVTALDTKTELATQGSIGSPGSLLIPSGMRAVSEVHVALAGDLAAVGSAGALIRLEGGGLPEGPETFAIGGVGAQTASGAAIAAPVFVIPTGGISVQEGNEILIYAEMIGGDDIGEITVGVAIAFE